MVPEGNALPHAGLTERSCPQVDSERIFQAVQLAQARFKIITDLGVKGIIFHLGISAFSLTFGFQNRGVSTGVIIGANVLVTVIAFLATIVVTKDAQRVLGRIVRWHKELGVDIHDNEMKGVITTAWLYTAVCLIILCFWLWLLAFPSTSAAT